MQIKINKKLLLTISFCFLSFIFASANAGSVSAISNIDAQLATPGVKYVGTNFNLNVRVNTDGLIIDTVSIRNLNFDNTKLSLVNTSIQTIFASQTTLSNVNGPGTKRVDIGKLPLTANYSNTSHTTFVVLTFQVLTTGGGPVGTTNITFDYDVTPSTTGTFLAGVKNLASVTPLLINLAEDNTPPLISNCVPTIGATGVQVISNVSCDVTDGETGIFLGGTTLTVNGITYTNVGPNTYTTSAIANGFTLTVNPTSNFPYFTTIPVSGFAQDNAYDNGPVLARNNYNLAPYTFQTEDDNDAPTIYNLNPASGAVNVATTTNIGFNIRDLANPGGYPGTGVNLASLQVTVSAAGWGSVIYTQAGPNFLVANAITSPYDYSILINPAIDFPQNTLVTVSVIASDFDAVVPSPNTLNTSYSFTTVDVNPPTCVAVSPTPASVTVQLQDNIVVVCSDNGTGVDIDQVSVRVNGITYTRVGANTFTYSGTSAAYTITVNPAADFNPEIALEVILQAQDLAGNSMQVQGYGLATGVLPISCVVCPPPTVVTNTVTNTVTLPGSTTVQTINPVVVPIKDVTAISLNERIISLDSSIKVKKSEGLLFIGKGIPNTVLTLKFESETVYVQVPVNSSGAWTLALQNIFELGVHKVSAVTLVPGTNTETESKLLGSFEVVADSQPTLQPEINTTYEFPWWLFILVAIIMFLLGYIFRKLSYDEQKDKRPNPKV